MTAFAACLFVVAAMASVATIIATVRRHGASAMALGSELAACPDTMELTWSSVERVNVPAIAALRKRPTRRLPARLEWPGLAQDGLGGLAA